VEDVQKAGHEDEDKCGAENNASGTRVLPLRKVSHLKQVGPAGLIYAKQVVEHRVVVCYMSVVFE